MEYEIQFARLATTEKLADRFLNTQLKANADLAKTQMGEVFSMIEILTQWFTTAQIGQTIINTFATAYYDGGSTSDLVNFEMSLKKVNETLAQITQNGETDWIGNLNAVLGVIIENKMHIAQTGRANAYVFRDGKMENLTEDLAQSGEPHPLKTFTNITSGELKNHDKILIANPELFNQIDSENLRQIITMNNPNEAVMQLAKLLKKKRVNTVNALIINLTTTEELVRQTVSTSNDTIYLDRPLESVWAGADRAWQQIIHPILKAFSRQTKKASDKSLDFTKNYLKTLYEKKQSNQIVQKKDLFEKEFISAAPEENILKDEDFKYSPELEVHYYQEKQKEKDNKVTKFLVATKPIVDSVRHFVSELIKNKKSKSYALVICAVVILIIIGFSIKNRSRSNSSGIDLNKAQATLKSAESAESDAKLAQNTDTEKTKQLCASAISQASPITSYVIVGSDAQKVISDCNGIIDSLTSTTRFSSLNPLLSLDNSIQDAFVINSQAYLISNNSIYRALISGGKPEKVASIPQNNGNFQFGALMGNNILLYTTSQKVYNFNATNNQITLSSGNWESANAGAVYNGSFYLLDSVLGQIYKHAFVSGVAQPGSSYITSKSIDIKDSKSIAIDGSIFILRSNGDVIELVKGKLQTFAISGTPTPYSRIEKPVKIYTDADATSIYILDNGQKRILEYDKNGSYIHQYALPSTLNDLTDFTVSIKAKKMWVISDKSLYEISI